MIMGMYFKKLVVLGKGKESSELLFSTGLNVLSGASNTGKTYVFQCIDFILGSSDSPKDIEEAKGYTEARAEIHSYDGVVFSLVRRFGDNKIYLAECTLEEFNNQKQRQMSIVHSDKNNENISSYLLELLGLRGKKLKKNALNDKDSLSFRDIARFCLINENKIITEDPPIFTGQYTTKTKEESLFKLLVSGKDDDELETFENPQIAKSKIHGKLEFIEHVLKNKNAEITKLKLLVTGFNLDELSIQISELTKIVDEANKSVLEEEKKRQAIWNEYHELKSELNHTKELENRFHLLNAHYESDMKRLEFINEGKQLVGLLKDVECPVCGALMSKEDLDDLETEEESSKIKTALMGEFRKIQKKKIELIKTLVEIESDKNDLLLKLKEKQTEFNELNQFILSKLKPVYEVNEERLKQCLTVRENSTQIGRLQQEIFELLNERKYYEEKLKEKQQKAQITYLPENIYEALMDEIKLILCEWGLNCTKVEYNKTENDIEIDGKLRRNFGKGFRAIYLSAFMIAVMKYCMNNKLKHPFLLVLDSPLTSYKAKDVVKEDDRVSTDIQNNFFISLSKMQGIENMQIFVIDNKDSPESINDFITYEHFTGNNKIGRFGFFPIK